jgi:GNAT superfamily N-acetyltransferase
MLAWESAQSPALACSVAAWHQCPRRPPDRPTLAPMPSVVTLADRPELAEAARTMPTGVPLFMLNDPMSWNFASLGTLFPAYQLALLDDEETVIGRGSSAPIPWDGTPADLPDQGWDDVMGRAVRAHLAHRPTPAVAAFQIVVRPELRGQGLSRLVVIAMRDNARLRGHTSLVAPVRPNGKDLDPMIPMEEYARRVRADGLPMDPWLRVHARLGATIVKVCPASMAIAGSLKQWREWTGLPFDQDGMITVSGALAPVHVSIAHDRAVYVEPNVWMRHDLG